MQDDLSTDIRYADIDLPPQPPFKQRIPTQLRFYELSPLFELLEQNVLPEPTGIFRYWHIFFLMILFYYLVTLIVFLICLDSYDLTILILKYPLVYVITCCLFALAITSLHYKPNIVKRFPQNYMVFIFTAVPGVYIAVFISIYFRDYYPETYLFNLVIIHLLFYLKYQASIQEYFTLSILKAQNDEQHEDEDSQQLILNEENQIINQDQENLQPEVQEKEHSHQTQQSQSQHSFSRPSQNQSEALSQQQQQGQYRASSISIQEQQQQPLEVQQEPQQDDVPLQENQQSSLNFVEQIKQKPMSMPNEKFVLHENWMFLIFCSFILPLITLRNFDNYLTVFQYIVYGMITMIYLCIVFFHLKVYELDSRIYTLHYSWANAYYLCLSYWFSDFLWPPFLIRQIERLGDQIYKKMNQENEIKKQFQSQDEIIELIPDPYTQEENGQQQQFQQEDDVEQQQLISNENQFDSQQQIE